MTKLRLVTDDDLEDLLGPEPDAELMTLDEMRARPPLQPWTFGEYERIPATPWLIGDDDRPMLIARGLWVTFGLYKSGKTYVSLEQAFCIAAGVEFNGMPTMQGRVAYICAEGDAKRIIGRVVALCKKHGKDPAEVLAPRALNLIMSTINLIQPDGVTGVDTLLAQLTGDEAENGAYVAIWLDTWAKMLAAFGGHDSDADSVMPAIAGCDRIREVLRCSVILVAHVGVSEKAQDRPKGLSDLPGQVDGGTKCERVGEGKEALFTFRAVIQRYAPDGFTVEARMTAQEPDSVLKFLTKREVAKATLDDDQNRMLELLRALGAGATVDAWRDETLAADIWRVKKGKTKGQPIGNPRDKWDRELKKLVAGDWIEITGTMVSLAAE
jgi:hypothetical protein